MQAKPTTILLADDHAVVRSGLALLIGSQPDMEVVAEAESADEAVARCREHRPDVAVLDLSMPGGGVGAIGRIRHELPETRVVVLTMHDDQEYLRAALAAGTAGYVVKAAADEELLQAIRAVHRGRSYISLSLSPADASLEPPSSAKPLSHRERQVLELVAFGHTSQRIADQLGLSIKTVDGYRARIADKLGLRSRADLVRYALEMGILRQDRHPPDE